MKAYDTVNAYLFFNGRCEEAINFYQKAIGAEPQMLMRYKQMPPDVQGQDCSPKMDGEKLMHARIRIGESTVMLADGPCTGNYDGFALSLAAKDPADAENKFKALSAGGSVIMPLAKTFFSPAFGMLTDKFGVKWMIIIHAPV